MPLSEDDITGAVERYTRERDRFQKLVDFVHLECVALVRENAVPATVQSRTKDPTRLGDKLRPRREDFTSVDAVFGADGIKDFAAVRVATYVERDRAKAVRVIQERFSGPGGADVVVDLKDSDEHFYRGTHCLVTLRDDDLVAGYENLRDTRCEIQVCSLLAHVWNEIEHDRAYKPASGELNNQETNALASLGNLTRAGDNIIETLLTATDARLAEEQGVFQDQWDFVARARRLFPDASDFGSHSGQLFEELVSAGIDTPEKLRELVDPDGPERASTLLVRLQAYLDETDDGIVRQVDSDSSDGLLMLLLDGQAAEVLERHPAGPGLGRPPRIASVARRYLEMLADPTPPPQEGTE